MIRKRKAMHAMPKTIMLRCYGWWWQDSVENVIRVLDSFIKQLIVNVLAQFFKYGQMQCVYPHRFDRRRRASIRCRSEALVNPLQALAAQVRLTIMTHLKLSVLLFHTSLAMVS